MNATDETVADVTIDSPVENGVLRCRTSRLRSPGTPILDSSIEEQGARRLGTLAILTAVTIVGITAVQHILQPELREAQAEPLFRLAALFFVLGSIGLAAVERFELAGPQLVLDIGLGFEVAGALAIGIMENSLAWTGGPLRQST